MTGTALIALALIIPAAAAVLIPLFHERPNLREAVTMIGAFALFATILLLLSDVMAGARPALALVEILPGLSIAFAVEPLGMLFATVASGLWIVNSVYSIGYMRAEKAPRQTSFYVCFALALAATMGLAFAGNLFTLFLFYEALTLSTYPLVTHRATPEAIRAGRLYLLMLVGASTLLLLPAIGWTAVAAGTLDFTPGGILAGKIGGAATGALLALFVFGAAKSAVMPLHFWLPAAMVAPTPVSALLHAVAVVKAGVFTILKVVVYIFGPEFLSATSASDWLVYVAAFTILAASLIAFRQDDLKRRLAYSTVSQLSYVVLGAALATRAGILGGGLQIAAHAVGKITLFFCAGAISVAAHKTKVSELAGLGRRMPVTFACFFVGALSIVGLPPTAGLWSKWYLGLATVEAGELLILAVLMLSSLLSLAYLLPIPLRAFFGKARGAAKADGIAEAPWPILVAVSATALACLVLFFFPDPFFDLLQQALAR